MARRMNPLYDSTGLLSARPPTPREYVAGVLSGLLGDTKEGYQGLMGLLGQSSAQTPEAQARDMLNPMGGLLGMYDAGQDLGKGQYLAGGLGLLGSTPAGKVAKKIRAYHGSPHSFDKFSMDKIGTGEGAQAYGHGLYFAENEGTAKSYRDALSRDQDFVLPSGRKVVPWVARGATTLPQRLAEIRADFQERLAQSMREKADGDWNAGGRIAAQQEVLAALDEIEAGSIPKETGSMYEVEINADPDSFLDWDKPLSEQPQITNAVRNSPQYQELAASRHFGYASDEFANLPPEKRAELMARTPESMHENILFPERPGRGLYDSMGDQPQATETLRQAGIPGLKYLDGGSRRAGDGTRNYVVFDDSIISIVRKYGIAGALAAGAISQTDAQELFAQGYE